MTAGHGTGSTGAVVRRRKLGRALRELREAAGLSVETAAPRLDWSTSKLSRIENGQQAVDVHGVPWMAAVLATERYRPGDGRAGAGEAEAGAELGEQRRCGRRFKPVGARRAGPAGSLPRLPGGAAVRDGHPARSPVRWSHIRCIARPQRGPSSE